MTRAVIIGDSHTSAIAGALRSAGRSADGLVVHRLENSKRAYIRDTISLAGALEVVSGLPQDVPVFVCMLGTYHNIIGLLRPNPQYDFLLDHADASANGGVPVRVPHRAIASMFEEHLAGAETVKKLRAAAKSPMHLLSAPPPKQSNEFMVEKFMRQTKRAYRGQSIEMTGLAPPGLRLKLWALETRVLERWANEQEMGFVPAPPKAFNDDGFLGRKYYFDDATHANAKYGALVLEQIVVLLDGKNGTASHG